MKRHPADTTAVVLTLPLLLLLILAVLAPPASGQHCTKDGKLLPLGHVVPHPEDACLSEVCRCASEDRCAMVSERRMLMVRVNENRQSGPDAPPVTVTKVLQCSCVDHVPGSTEMDFTCKSPSQPGRDVGAKVIGCLNRDGILRLPGEKVTIRNLRGEALVCDCNSNGHSVNCLPEDDPGDTCLDNDTGLRVPLMSTYYRLEKTSRGLPVRLRCVCVRSDQETSCTVA